MHLKDWREAKGLTRQQLAERLARTPEAVRRYEEGERIPDRATMSLIVAVTDGRVTPNDFFGVSTPGASEKQEAA
ncbi:MAG: helix-turn-helix transcriptional regulator [Sphingobium sp.]